MNKSTNKLKSLTTVVAWGQYVYWCELQFSRFRALPEEKDGAHHIGVVAHWLASEHVVLEGWLQLRHSDEKLEKLISLYPDNVEALRRCRNAVYHFQTEILDKRIIKCLFDKNEELLWSIALHYEFQRYLLNFPYTFSGTQEEKEELAEEMAGCVGWWPTETGSAGVRRIFNKCMGLASIASDDDSVTLAASTIEKLARLDAEPFSANLSRWITNVSTS